MSIIKFSSQMLKDKCGFVDFQFKYNDDFIQNLCKDIYIIAIGLKENKKLEKIIKC